MKLTLPLLIALLLSLPASAADDPTEVIISGEIELSCMEGFHRDADASFMGIFICTADAHTCGEGPHDVKFVEDVTCPQPPPIQPIRRPDGNYSRDRTVTYVIGCQDVHTETWTDWPECDGAVVVWPEEGE